jgi:hypothetical protein
MLHIAFVYMAESSKGVASNNTWACYSNFRQRKGAHIFRYQTLGRAKGRITWQSSGRHRLSGLVYNAWENVLTGDLDFTGGNYVLEESKLQLHEGWVTNIGVLCLHLRLKEQIMRASTRQMILICSR